ncbi:type IV secretion system DNA-binding domain-containing protein [Succinivibrio sp.]|uniref:type IV secretion system DNA-binding domain-containing protein n=1 Tax=Succinivibrio sp. TaxID=2053619 RepID=UPI0025E9028B|nr:type IV secretion system DNA-binding domain-containing protein [Succinivibrio sp.]MBQ9221470.1 type IV secretion system DNA-binding domain-containing protein [Succinivibrio sp.]
MTQSNLAKSDPKNIYLMVMSFNICWFIVNFFFTDLFFMFLNGIFLCFTTIACIVFLGFEEFYFASRNISSFFEISVKKLHKKLNNERFSFKNRKFSSDPVYLGVGYEFKPKHSRELHSLLDLGLSGSNGPNQGSFQIHNLGKSKDIYTHVKDLEGHTLIFGTPGSGKTRFFDLLISQAIYRNDVVVVIDPKGDTDLREKARRAAQSLGRRFEVLDTYTLENNTSAFNLLGSSFKPTEIADRLTSLLDSKSDFSNYASEAICAAVISLNYMRKPVTISSIKNSMSLKAYFQAFLTRLISYAFENNSKEALDKLIAFFLKSRIPFSDFPKLEKYMAVTGNPARTSDSDGAESSENSDEEGASDEESSGKTLKKVKKSTTRKASSASSSDPYSGTLKTKARSLYQIYEFIRSQNRNSSPAEEEFEHLYSMCCKDETYFIKVSSSVNPIMSSLSMSSLSSYFSKESGAISIRDIYMSNAVFYVSLNALKNSLLCAYVGKLILSDLCSFCGDIYARNHSGPNISIFVDEAAEVCNEYLVQLLNKGRGARASVTLATQTLSDFKKKFGSEYAATQFIGNCNNMIALRIKDADTAKAFTSTLPKTSVYRSSKAVASRYDVYTRGISESCNYGVSAGEAPIFPDSALMMLPNFEYVAKLNDGRFIKGVIPVVTAE